MKQKTIATRHLRTKIAAGYVLILFVIFGIVYIWLNEQHRRQELEITSQKIRCLRKDIHEVYVKMVDLSLIGETVLDWNEEDMNIYHKKRLEVDSLLSLFKSSYRSERIDSVCQLLAEKENMLNTLLNFFRLDSGKEQANAVPFRLKNVIEILLTEFEPRAEAKDLTLRITGCSDIILMGDRNRLVQIGNNLLSNAIKFTESGTVGLDIRRLYQRALQERER
ncbi:hypothetical protein H6A37_04345 [Phocaeicola plebeius]|uniref:sensor histidine kinase n=1 Tax=Phocaeicola plebeius TaxID=310297 RepID=UPI0019599ECD|nr:hypothetical protein [Phocaeicola plebeius]MBM6963069.1 hypothetical protein [Phocaeicola plebeius]